MRQKRVKMLRKEAYQIWSQMDKQYRDVIPPKMVERKHRKDYHESRKTA